MRIPDSDLSLRWLTMKTNICVTLTKLL